MGKSLLFTPPGIDVEEQEAVLWICLRQAKKDGFAS